MSVINFERAANLEGFLKKKSPVKFTGYQKRYFMVKDSGKLLAYFAKKPKSGDEPKGVLLLNLITNIVVVDETKFTISYGEREFHLRADNTDSQTMWVASLRFLSEKAKETQSEVPSNTNWKDKKLAEEIVQIVKQESEVIPPSPKLSESSDPNLQILVTKGIWKYISVYPEKLIKRFFLYGFLNKRSKGTVKYFQKRWCIMVSGAPLIPTNEEDSLNESGLPPWMFLNHIYYFKYSGPDDDSEAQGEIPTRLCTIRIKDMTESRDSGSSFLLDLGNRIFHFNADSEEDMNRWVKAIDTSKESALDITSSITGRPKFIKKLIQLFDTHGVKGLKAKIEDKFKKEILKFSISLETLKEILDEMTKLVDDMISSIDGCVSSRPQRLDVAENYSSSFHKRLSDHLSTLWKELHSTCSTEDIMKLIIWTNNYEQQLKKIGINDDKLANGIIVLSKNFSDQLFDSACKSLITCLRSAFKGEVQTDPRSRNYIIGYADLCGIIEPIFIELQNCSEEHFAAAALDTVREVVLAYKNAVTEICERNLIVPLNCIAGFSNDTVLIIDRFKSWQMMAKTGLEAGLINEHLKAKVISQEYQVMEQVSKRCLARSLLDRVNESFDLPFSELHMERLFPNIVSELDQIEGFTDKNLVKFIWRSLLEEVIQKYLNCIFHNKKALKTQSILLLSETLRSDTQMFSKYFSQKFDKNIVEKELAGLKDIVEFLEALPSDIGTICERVKNLQGQDFDFNSAKFLIELREDLDKAEKKECIAKVKEVMDKLKSVTKASFESKNEMSFANQSIDDLQETNIKKPIQRQDSSLKVTQTGTYANFKGYLQKKNKQKILKFDERFFSIKNDRLYWYKSHKSREPLNSLNLFDAQVSYNGKNSLRFDVKTSSKTVKLLAKDQEDKQNWLKALEKPPDTELTIQFLNEISKDSLFEDYGKATYGKRDLMRIANWVLAEVPRRRPKKGDKIEKIENQEKEEGLENPDLNKESTSFRYVEQNDDETSGCCCFAFFKRKKDIEKPLLINSS